MPKQRESQITDTFKKTKNSKESSNVIGKTNPKPSTSANDEIVDKEVDLLRQFDLNWEYGPCIGITRLERWQRAEKHGLNPSPEVKQLILAHQQEEKYTQCVWNDYKNIL